MIHFMTKRRGNGTALGTTFLISKIGRITFSKEMAKKLPFKEGDAVAFGWTDSTTPHTLCLCKVEKECADGFTFHVAYKKRPASISVKQVTEIVVPGRYNLVKVENNIVFTDCPVV